MELVLASSSHYRRELLERLRWPFTVDSPDINERPEVGEPAHALVARLAERKARAVADRHPNGLVIGSDQVALCEGRILGKPGTEIAAVAQLHALRGQTVQFLTGLCVFNVRDDRARVAVERVDVTFRDSSDAAIAAYVTRELPLDCAGAFKSERLGIALVERLRGNDPSALIGLPLIRLVTLLAEEGVDVLVGPPAA